MESFLCTRTAGDTILFGRDWYLIGQESLISHILYFAGSGSRTLSGARYLLHFSRWWLSFILVYPIRPTSPGQMTAELVQKLHWIGSLSGNIISRFTLLRHFSDCHVFWAFRVFFQWPLPRVSAGLQCAEIIAVLSALYFIIPFSNYCSTPCFFTRRQLQRSNGHRFVVIHVYFVPKTFKFGMHECSPTVAGYTMQCESVQAYGESPCFLNKTDDPKRLAT